MQRREIELDASRKKRARTLYLNAIYAAAMLTSTGLAWSAVNKCTEANGKVTYTEQPCAQNQSQAIVKTTEPPSPEGQKSGMRKSPGQLAQCERALKAIENLKAEVVNERNKNKTELLATAKQEIASAEKIYREQCN